MSTKPHIVLIPGAWHDPSGFSEITAQLESAGYTVHSRQLPSVGNPIPPEDFSEDIAAVQDLVTKAIGDGNDVVVVPHSWSGIVNVCVYRARGGEYDGCYSAADSGLVDC